MYKEEAHYHEYIRNGTQISDKNRCFIRIPFLYDSFNIWSVVKMQYTNEFKIIGGLGCLLLTICLISTATAITEYESKAINPTFGNESYFSIYNDDSQTYQIYIYNYTGNDPFIYEGIIGRIEPHQSIYLPKNASYYLYCEYPDSIRLESLKEVKQGVNQYWVIAIVIIIIIVALYTGIRIIRGRRY